MSTILVTGGAGFIGSNLCRRLLDNLQNHVICFDNFTTGNINNVRVLLETERFNIVNGDILDILDVLDSSYKIDEIYNLACPAAPLKYQEEPIYTTKVNTIGVLNLLNLARKNHAKFLQASTSEVYGDPLIFPQKENYLGNVNCTGIRSCYDEGKRCAESLIFDYARKYGSLVKVVRIFNTYGPFMSADDGRVISNFIVQALRGENLTIYGRGEQTRSFCYIDDLVDGLLKMMSTEDSFQGPVNLGNPDERTIFDVASLIRLYCENSSDFSYKVLPKDDPKRRCPDISLAMNVLKWKPKVDLEVGLEKTIQYFRDIV